MKRPSSLFGILGISVWSLSGCMAMGMCEMQHGSSHQAQHAGETVLAEVRRGEVIVALEVPPLSAGIESTLSVKVSRADHGEPVSGAKVTVAISQLTSPSADPAGHHPPTPLERRAEEGGEKGVYSVQYAFAAHGLHEIVARVWVEGGDESAAPVTVAATREVHRQQGAKGRMDLVPMGVLYGAGMGLLMALMMGRFL